MRVRLGHARQAWQATERGAEASLRTPSWCSSTEVRVQVWRPAPQSGRLGNEEPMQSKCLRHMAAQRTHRDNDAARPCATHAACRNTASAASPAEKSGGKPPHSFVVRLCRSTRAGLETSTTIAAASFSLRACRGALIHDRNLKDAATGAGKMPAPQLVRNTPYRV